MMRYLSIVTGTSSDGVDVTLADVKGCGKNTIYKLINYKSFEYPGNLHELLLRLSNVETITTEVLSETHWELGLFGIYRLSWSSIEQ